ncbi:MucB/RseB C-terminal domain-containing protein [Chitinibacter sp. GC72]|uniref:MucB/RseB C-terminal domain-containing protein n=1 Tax=Chitinibacter sp. GC72 TaxID=1526917 RepID=UPI0018E02228|nr:MucB/RseB C-terminal domain-containing protein [Chitinibacter sp. GC72]
MSACAALLLALPASHAAEMLDKDDAGRLLERTAAVAKTATYAGTYVYQYGEEISSYRMIHVLDGSNDAERRETLDGPPREYYRHGNQVSIYPADPQQKALDRRYTAKLFPRQLPDPASKLLSAYGVVRLGHERVAGRDATVYQLQPLDQYRYPHRFWVDEASSLLLKWVVMGMRKEATQIFAFTNIQLGGNVDRKLLKPTRQLQAVEIEAGNGLTQMPQEANWDIKVLPAGFKLLKQTSKTLPGKHRSVIHHLYSDGAATVSVFIEPFHQRLPLGLAHQGAMHMYVRQSGTHLVMALGEVPGVTVEAFANAYNAR